MGRIVSKLEPSVRSAEIVKPSTTTFETVVLNLLNKGRVTQLLFLALGIEVVEYRQQHRRYR